LGVNDLELRSESDVTGTEFVLRFFSMCLMGGEDVDDERRGDEAGEGSEAFLKISRRACCAVDLSSAV